MSAVVIILPVVRLDGYGNVMPILRAKPADVIAIRKPAEARK